MKTFSKLMLGLFLSFSVLSCFGSDDDDSHQSDDDNGGTTQVITSGNWKVTFFEEDGSNQTQHFSDFTFTFNDNQTVTATNGTVNKSGIWNTGNDDSSNKLVIEFNDNDGPFEEISEDWEIVSKTPSKIELRHVSGGDGSIDYLTFEKM